ncbi:sugar ABC transporter ATP-binding protein [Paraburkholderia megapolitana]|uniref:Monosaccharide ABC transporter ATP-binding protein, CUT2 family n=1 Tax=Paraburkholderia megapolitana TaxID=420953 RepID=A0A1I3IUC5_9BURK|nr:sugar ABC transporter ATP-binding protein [Paraburkholderia megapolitana]SFI51473.1 monosaccharide ABC transporter ATP-binding protein, CUT2 family [Paraburkholderia megapolitana]
MNASPNRLCAQASGASFSDGADVPFAELRSIAKSFGTVEAIKNVSLALRSGRVHTILGENGAGKSTLMKILAGVHQPTKGDLLVRGQPVVFATPSESQAAGISIIYQELSLAANLTVAENIFAGHEPQRFGIVDFKSLFRQAQDLLDDLAIDIDAHVAVARLSMAQRQLVEIAKGLSRRAELVIMDEPTSSLSDREAEVLFGIVAKLKSRGIAVVYISHRMDEIMRISDDISVMRDGQYICTHDRNETTIGALINLMVGREMSDVYPPRATPLNMNRAPLLEVRNLTINGKFHDISFGVRPGEIFGFFGLIGAGRSDVMKALFGIGRPTGQILMDGKAVRLRSPERAISAGIAFVTEDRKHEGLVLMHSIAQNITMASFERKGSRFGIVSSRYEQRETQDAIARMKIRTAGPQQAVGDLSGGNQQKVVFSKWLSLKPKVLILDEPTRGVDVGAKFEIYRVMRELADAGTAIVLVSSELPEALAMSDRLAVMREKRLVREFATAGLTQETVMSYATGAAPA